MTATMSVNKMKKEIELERKEWARCSVCEGEYAKDIRINPPCLHSYCSHCILDSSSTTKLCPICKEALPDDLSTLPHNIVLQHWLSLSPSPSLPALPEVHEQCEKQCDECEATKTEVYCVDCDCSYCLECSIRIHSFKGTKNHRVETITGSLSSFSSACNIFEYPLCVTHKMEKKNMYCQDCDELLCNNCIAEDHSDHKTITVEKYIGEVKDKWKREYEEEHKRCTDLHNFDGEEKECTTILNKLKEEIRGLEESLDTKRTEEKEFTLRLEKIRSLRTRHAITHRFVSSFLSSLPTLPLSSFYPLPSNPTENNNNNNSTVDCNNNVEKRIKDFFTKKEIHQLYFNDAEEEKELSNRDEEKKREEEERNRRTGQMIKANELIEGENLICSFGSRGQLPLQFNNPIYQSINSSLNLIAVSDFNNHRVQLLHINPSLSSPSASSSSPSVSYRTHIQVGSPRGVAFIPSLNVLAVASMDDNQIHIFGVDDLLLPHPYPLLPPRYSIPASLFSAPLFTRPYGIAYSEEIKLLAVADYWKKRIQFISGLGKGDGRENDVSLHSSLSLPFHPDTIAFTPPLLSYPTLLLISNRDDEKVEMFAPSPHPSGGYEWEKLKEFGSVRCPRGVAFLPSPSPCVLVCDEGNAKKGIEGAIKVFSFSSSALVCTFSPSGSYFKSAWGISVDYPFIAVSDPAIQKITLMRGGDIPQ